MSIERKREEEEELEKKAIESSIVISVDAAERLKRINERIKDKALKRKVSDEKAKNMEQNEREERDR